MPQLKFSQQLSLLPMTVPEAIVDFLDGVEKDEALTQETFVASLAPELFSAQKDALANSLREIRSALGGVVGVQVEPFGKELPNAYWCKLTGASLTRGIGFVLKNRTSHIVKIEFQQSDFNDDELKKKLA